MLLAERSAGWFVQNWAGLSCRTRVEMALGPYSRLRVTWYDWRPVTQLLIGLFVILVYSSSVISRRAIGVRFNLFSLQSMATTGSGPDNKSLAQQSNPKEWSSSSVIGAWSSDSVVVETFKLISWSLNSLNTRWSFLKSGRDWTVKVNRSVLWNSDSIAFAYAGSFIEHSTSGGPKTVLWNSVRFAFIHAHALAVSADKFLSFSSCRPLSEFRFSRRSFSLAIFWVARSQSIEALFLASWTFLISSSIALIWRTLSRYR